MINSPKLFARLALAACLAAANFLQAEKLSTWTADNGNGTFTNPLFYDEFSDPDMIRVGDDYYLTGTTMHSMPGLPILHSRDLVNWQLLTYAFEKLDLGPNFRLEDGEIYGQGIWAPCLRYHDGIFYIFTNINGEKTQILSATDPAGPWQREQMKVSLHDLSVLFDDDGKAYAIWGYNEIRMVELTDDLLDIVPGSERIIIPAGSGIGEGVHFYKIDGQYIITSSNYSPMLYMACARASQIDGPYEVTTISARETLGKSNGWRLEGWGRGGPEIELIPPAPESGSTISLHQGGLVDTPSGQWWGFSMIDYNSVGRLTCLSPVTWQDDWPYFGLPGNLTRTPRTWVKPETEYPVDEPHAPYQRSDEFESELANVWQWSHVPNDQKWSLSERAGFLRLHSTPAESYWTARNTLTQRAVGPISIATTHLDLSGLKPGDRAGLALANFPYARLAAGRDESGFWIERYDQISESYLREAIDSNTVSLRVECDFDTEQAQFSYSVNGQEYTKIGEPFTMVFQLKTFQGIRYSLFNFNQSGSDGGYADFDSFELEEPVATAKWREIPVGKKIKLISKADGATLVSWNGFLRPMSPDSDLAKSEAAHLTVVDRGQGRIALKSSDGSFIRVTGVGATGDVRFVSEESGQASLFQWQDMLNKEIMLLSLHTNRYLNALPSGGELTSADSPGATPNRKGGSCFTWQLVE
ncbi:glycoside hydrolase family 43 protein [Pelagicoccus albus]|uniref:Glycosyl hydrolase 43 family protein n=1 Tax=Pelagicoccus albus TaxID=415222 RepID=A0A7X1EA53_9BACT|nr:glycoside hydrolase 43 family protein [Pelagicoccus albus]MBC2608016.1 glycosyl hydrolase 43 family protein [Pelagicoccus albus]